MARHAAERATASAAAPAAAGLALRPVGWIYSCGAGVCADALATAPDRCQVLTPVRAGVGLVLLS
jgi:hypothetical protein